MRSWKEKQFNKSRVVDVEGRDGWGREDGESEAKRKGVRRKRRGKEERKKVWKE